MENTDLQPSSRRSGVKLSLTKELAEDINKGILNFTYPEISCYLCIEQLFDL